MKILITGGNGFIARNLKPLFEQNGYDVDAPSHIEMDLLNFQITSDYLIKSSPDIIIHAATKGGRRIQKDTWEDVFIPNIKMFEHLSVVVQLRMKVRPQIIIIGSGAEFDRRLPIQDKLENTLQLHWPIDPYGLSKNIIARRCTKDFDNIWLVRLFGCFNFDDDPSRFIKAGILNLKRGLPIEVHQNKEMDYFYLDDVFTVMDYIIREHPVPRDINLVYDIKTTLMDIVSLIHHCVGKFGPPVNLAHLGMSEPYTGSHELLYQLPIAKSFIGLEEGIRRTVQKLT